MFNPLTQKLSSFTDFSAEDRRILDELVSSSSHRPRSTTLIRDGERPERIFVLIRGWAYRHKLLPSGARQITGYLLPGDLCDPRIFLLDQMDHGIAFLSDATVATISKARMIEVLEQRPAISRALWWSTMVDEGVLRQWLVNVGQRDAYGRIAHLFCEMWERAHRVGLTQGGALDFPLTQEQLGDTTGLTPVHTNRVLKRMRAEGLISLNKGRLVIEDQARLRATAGFNANYLHLGRHAQP